MSTGKRLAKRSIIGTRVVAKGDDGMFYSGVIHAVKTPAAAYPENNNCINLTPKTRFSVRFDVKNAAGKRDSREYAAKELVGPGFGGVQGLVLPSGQGVFLTFNGREVGGKVRLHDPKTDEVFVVIQPQGSEVSFSSVLNFAGRRFQQKRRPVSSDASTDLNRTRCINTWSRLPKDANSFARTL